LRVALRQVGVNPGELAAPLNRSQSFVNKLLNGKTWPKGLQAEFGMRAGAGRGHAAPADDRE
jgi:hypothetical protein